MSGPVNYRSQPKRSLTHKILNVSGWTIGVMGFILMLPAAIMAAPGYLMVCGSKELIESGAPDVYEPLKKGEERDEGLKVSKGST